MGSGDPTWCPVLRPTRHEFSRPFTAFVEDAFKANPGAAMLRVIPPKGWTPRTEEFPSLDDIRISTPIKQHVFGTKGAYRCLLEEQRGLSVSDFKKLAYRDDHQPPRQGHRDDGLLERAFWSSITLSPPFYGADTPFSFFDEHLRFGWNLRKLQCLLTQHDIPNIPGVTTPMTYFGMWKSFFSWHIEDVDLYSINYLHFGAPKVWYSVSPADRQKFENMATQLFPELARNCKAFLRHKDILISPRVLRAFNVPFQQAKQQVGEFIVLAAGAYHSGFNQGFNCAEAVNFALPDWVPLGRKATRCTCSALNDAVRLDMTMFKPEGEVWSEEEETSSDEDDSSQEEETSVEEAEGEEAEESGSEMESDDSDSAASSQTNASDGHTGDTAARRARHNAASSSGRGRKPSAKAAAAAAAASSRGGKGSGGRVGKATVAKASAGGVGRGRKARPVVDEDGNVDMAALNALMPRKMGRPFKNPENAAKAATKIAAKAVAALAEAIAESPKRGRPFKNPENEARAAAQKAELMAELQAKVRQAKKFAAAAKAAAAAAAAQGDTPAGKAAPAARAAGAKRRAAAADDEPSPKRAAKSRQQQAHSGSGKQQAAAKHQSPVKRENASPPPASRRYAAGTRRAGDPPPDGSRSAASPTRVKSESWPSVRDSQPMVIVGQDQAGVKYFYMVAPIKGMSITPDGVVSLRWLAEGKDGLYRPTAGVYQEKVGALISVRTQWLQARGRREGGYKLLTQRSRILDMQLVD